jgi:hypothetical protein
VVTPRGRSIEIPRRYYSTCDSRCLGCCVMPPPAAAWILAASTLNPFRQYLWRTMLRSTSLYVSACACCVSLPSMTHALPSPPAIGQRVIAKSLSFNADSAPLDGLADFSPPPQSRDRGLSGKSLGRRLLAKPSRHAAVRRQRGHDS